MSYFGKPSQKPSQCHKVKPTAPAQAHLFGERLCKLPRNSQHVAGHRDKQVVGLHMEVGGEVDDMETNV